MIGIIFVCTVALQLFGLALGRVWYPTDTALNLTVFAVQLFNFWVRGPRLNIACLAVLIPLMVSILSSPEQLWEVRFPPQSWPLLGASGDPESCHLSAKRPSARYGLAAVCRLSSKRSEKRPFGASQW
ncbi:hypothetical protein [Tsuneonella amylolytica]|uniref:hypothetical protein n=1 Tax=Tsuneonella amylolytica TaxID=2338327 RepID=UPI0013C52AC5|nr:hypothetical protein [Tsuneonella amylolytica]